MIEDDDPDKVNPAPDRNNDGENYAKDVANGWLFNYRRDTDENLGDPVNKRDKKQDNLDEARLAVEPFH